MSVVLTLLFIQGLFGAFDTVYYHEWKARLPGHGPKVASELYLHAIRDFVYAALFASLPFVAFYGGWTIFLILLLLTEIIITMTDFVVEKTTRKPQGDLEAGERVTHGVMAIIYGLMLAHLIPVLLEWYAKPTDLVYSPVDIPFWMKVMFPLFSFGLLTSGLRDLLSARGVKLAAWPWKQLP